MVEKETMKKVKGKILGVIGVLAVFGIYYYAALPAFNIHSMEFWILLIVLLVLAAGIYGKIAKVKPDKIRKSKGMRIFLSLILIVIGCGSIAVFTDCECRKISEADGCGERRIFKRY